MKLQGPLFKKQVRKCVFFLFWVSFSACHLLFLAAQPHAPLGTWVLGHVGTSTCGYFQRECRSSQTLQTPFQAPPVDTRTCAIPPCSCTKVGRWRGVGERGRQWAQAGGGGASQGQVGSLGSTPLVHTPSCHWSSLTKRKAKDK